MRTLPEKMSGVLLLGHGGPEMLEYRSDLAVPQAREHEVVIRVAAAGVNNTDINTRIGWYSKSADDVTDDATWSGIPLSFPRVQGADVCGEIVAVGANVDAARMGERVLIDPCICFENGEKLTHFAYFGSECNGGFAQYTVVSAVHAHKIESGMTDTELASFPCSYSTAENMLTYSQVQAGETVLVTGASGGVGSAAVQLANARGANVIAIASASKADDVLALGAKQVIPRGESVLAALGAESVDAVIDLVGGDQWPELLDVLKVRGRYAVAGAIAGPMVELDLRTLYLKDLRFYGCTRLEEGVFANLVKWIESGKIKPLVAASFPLQEIAQAQELFQSKGYTGKIVLMVG